MPRYICKSLNNFSWWFSSLPGIRLGIYILDQSRSWSLLQSPWSWQNCHLLQLSWILVPGKANRTAALNYNSRVSHPYPADKKNQAWARVKGETFLRHRFPVRNPTELEPAPQNVADLQRNKHCFNIVISHSSQQWPRYSVVPWLP